MIKEVLHPKIHYYKNVIEDPELFIKDLEESDLMDSYIPQIGPWKEWKAYASSQVLGKEKDCRFNLFKNETLADRINSKLCSIVAHKVISVGESYSKDTGLELGFLPQSFGIKKYNVGENMGPHVDAHDDEQGSTVSMVIYLNDDYEGGDISFPDFEISIKPEAGSVVVFESKNIVHETKATRSGVKYMIPIFFFKR